MGTDADAHNGVLIHMSSFSNLFRTKARFMAAKSALLEDSDIVGQLKDHEISCDRHDGEDDEGDSDVSESKRVELGNAIKALEAVESKEAFQEWLLGLLQSCVGGEVGKYSDCWIENEDLLQAILMTAADAVGVTLPQFEVVAFGNARLSGLWSISYGEPYINFSADACFRRSLTLIGEKLAVEFGEDIEISQWVSISY